VLAHYVLQGFRVALDDLGAEHQSFATLLRIRPSVVKLDGVLVRGIERDPSRQHLLATLAEFGRRSGIEIVAEGIETRAQLGAVLAAGITLAQGFLLGRPAPSPQRPAPDILADLRARARTDRAYRPPEIAILALLARLRGAAGALDPMLQHVTDLACEMLDCERASLRMLDDSRSRLLVAARTGLPIHEPTDPEFRVGEGLAGWVAAHREPLCLDDAEADSRFVPKPGQARRLGAFLGVPLLDAQGAIGVLAVTSSVGTFTATQARWLQVIAGVATPYLDVARLRRIAVTDELTLALNRRALDALLPRQPAASDAALSVAVLDIDHFKAINDRLGHAIGDEVLRAVRRLLATTLRRGDEIVRLGGDEFLLILRGALASDAQQIADRACRIIAGTTIISEPVTISGGVAERFPHETREALMERADRALYRAKAAGRNRTAQG
jgi:diguanylate cyclase (GGDEF)-like protein